MEKRIESNLTELVFIIDRSGSMGELEDDTVGGFNSMLEKQKNQEGDCFVTTVLFDHQSEIIHDRLPVSEVPPLDTDTYFVRGTTAVMDGKINRALNDQSVLFAILIPPLLSIHDFTIAYGHHTFTIHFPAFKGRCLTLRQEFVRIHDKFLSKIPDCIGFAARNSKTISRIDR